MFRSQLSVENSFMEFFYSSFACIMKMSCRFIFGKQDLWQIWSQLGAHLFRSWKSRICEHKLYLLLLQSSVNVFLWNFCLKSHTLESSSLSCHPMNRVLIFIGFKNHTKMCSHFSLIFQTRFWLRVLKFETIFKALKFYQFWKFVWQVDCKSFWFKISLNRISIILFRSERFLSLVFSWPEF